MTELISASAGAAISRAADALRRGEVVGIPTETVYGLAVLPQAAPLERLLAIKRRATDKGIQLLVDSVDQAAALAVLTPAAEQLAAAYWPGGLTLVLERRPGVELPLLLGGGRPTLGIRLPDHSVPRRLAALLGPLAASSANISGQPAATNATLVVASHGDELALVLDDGDVRGGVASTVVDCTDPSSPRVLREGAIAAGAIYRLLGQD